MHFDKYYPAEFGTPFAGLEYDENTYTGLKGNFKGYFKGKIFQTNSLGFRDKERSYEKNNNVIRIVLLGSCETMGYGIKDGENYGNYLEEMLNNKHFPKRFEVINFAIPAYGVDDIIDILEKQALAFRPEIILIGNDFDRAKGLHKYHTPSKKNIFSALESPTGVSFFLQVIKDQFIQKRVRYELVKLRILKKWPDQPSEPNNLEYFFEKLKGIVNSKNVFFIDLRPMWTIDRKWIIDNEVEAAEADTLLQKMCSDYNFGYINTYKENYGSKIQEMIDYIGDAHANGKAHKIYAQAIYKAIKPTIDSLVSGRTVQK